MFLIEEGCDLIAGLEASEVLAHSFYCASAIGAWNYARFERLGIFTHGDIKVTVIDRCGMDYIC